MSRFLVLLVAAAHLHADAADEARRLTDAERSALLAAAEALQKGFENADAEVIIQGTNKAITKVVSQKQFEDMTRQAMAALKGIKFESNVHGEPTDCWKVKDGELCFLPRKSVLILQGRRVSSVAFFICIQENGKWSFLDNASVSKDPELLWRLFPELSRAVHLPPSEVEVLE